MPDGYEDDLDVELQVGAEVAGLRFEYLDEQGSAVTTTEKAGGSGYYYDSWSAGDAGDPVPEGSYDIEVVAWDEAGDFVRQTLGTVTLSWEQLVDVRTDARQTAARAIEERWTGRCSSIVRGGSRSWKHGIGLRSGSRCGGDAWRSSGVVVAGTAALPAGWHKGVINIGVTGGSARGNPTSTAALEAATRGGRWVRLTVLAPNVATHSEGWHDTERFTQHDGSIRWRVVMSRGHRYDLKAVGVSFEGVALR